MMLVPTVAHRIVVNYAVPCHYKCKKWERSGRINQKTYGGFTGEYD
jgi:hypothetical protein